MKKNRSPEVPVDDYNLDKVLDVEFRGHTLSIMPRYQEHFVARKYEDFSLNLLHTTLHEGSVFVDVGGHLGAFSLIASSLVGDSGKVTAFEPVPENRKLLQRNLKQNGYKSVDIRSEAISDESGETEFNIPWASDSAGLYEHPNAETIRKIKVKLARLDDMFSGQKVDFIKIDTEGNELKVLRGSRELIKANPDLKMLIEFNPECLASAGVADPSEYFVMLHKLGFRTFLVDENSYELVEVALPQDWPSAMQSREYANTYCVPKRLKRALISFHTSQYGGAEMVGLETARALSDLFVVDTVFPGEGPMYGEALGAGFASKIIPYISWARDHPIAPIDLKNENYLNSCAVRNLYETITTNAYDVVIGETITMPWAALASSAAHVPFVWHLHEFGNRGSLLSFDYDFDEVVKIINSLSTLVLVHSQPMREHFARHGLEEGRLEQCPLGIERPLLGKQKKKVRAEVFLMVGKLAEHKGQTEAIQAFRKFLDKGYKATLKIIGPADEPYLKEVNALIKQLNLGDHVTIKPFTKNVHKEYLAADVYLMCSRDESFGRVTAEALLRGLPVIGNGSGATPGLVKDGKNGLLYEQGNIGALAEAMERLATDEVLYKRLAHAAPGSIEDSYTPAKFKECIEEVILKATKQPARSASFIEKIVPTFAQVSAEYQHKIASEQKANQELRQQLSEMTEHGNRLSQEIKAIKDSKGWRMLTKIYTAKSKLPSKSRKRAV